MSNYMAIATVTAALAQIMQSAAQRAVGGASVEIGRPASQLGDGSLHKINVYLYHVSPNAALCNTDLPTRGGEGELTKRPRLALDLHYLLAFYGDGKLLEPERMLGAVTCDLHAHPVLTRQMIEDAVQDYSELSGSDLAREIEKVKFTPVPLSLDELSKLWSILFQTPHALSIVYQASVLLIDAGETPRTVLPVRRPDVYGMPVKVPLIEKIKAENKVIQPTDSGWPEEPINVESTLVIEGKNLQGEDTVVTLDGQNLPSKNMQVTNTRIRISLSAPGIRAGAHSLQVVQRIQLGSELHKIVQSNAVAFLLRPIIQKNETDKPADPISFGNSLEVTYTPPVGKDQRVNLLLYESKASSEQPQPLRSYLIDAPLNNGIQGEEKEASKISFPTGMIEPGTYLVRSQVDGAENLFDLDAKGRYIWPMASKK